MTSKTRWVAAAALTLALASGAGAASYAEDAPAPAPAPAPAAAPAPGYSATGTWQLLALVNQTRRAKGLPALRIDTKLAAVARRHTEEMAAASDLRHNDLLFTAAMHRTLSITTFGENVGWNYGVAQQHLAFMNSPLHRANIVNGRFRVAGFAVVRGANGKIWSTEDFGSAPS